MKRIFRRQFLLLFLFSFGLEMQTHAQVVRVAANCDRELRSAKEGSDSYKRMMEMEWRIHGQVLHFGKDTLRIPVDHVMDTVFYRQNLQSAWDTMICNFDKPKLVFFVYNDCCDAFNVCDSSMKRLVQASASFLIKGKAHGREYIGKMGDDGVLLSDGPAVVHPSCHSAVVPNIFAISISEIRFCSPPDSCDDWTCLQRPPEFENSKEIGFREISTVDDFLYLPIDSAPLIVTLDAFSLKVTLK